MTRTFASMPRAQRTFAFAGCAMAAGACWLVLDAVLPRGVPLGTVLLGAVFGSLYALNAMGLVLVYRANKVVNFAQAEFGSVAAVIAIELVLQWNLNYFAAAAIGLGLAALTGAVVEATVLRRFRKASRLVLAVATIALAQLLAGVSIIIPVLWQGLGSGRFETPWAVSFALDPVSFDGDHLAALVVAPLAAGALGWFLLRSRYGVAIRAAADNGDRASALGVPIRRTATIVWALAATLSALAVLLRVPIVGFTSFAAVSGAGSSLLLFTLAAAVIGRMESLPVTAFAAVLLGIYQEVVIWNYSTTAAVDASLLAVILVALLVRRDTFSRGRGHAGTGSWSSTMREPVPIAKRLASLPEIVWGRRVLLTAVLGAAVAVPLVASPTFVSAATLALVYAVLGVSLVVLTGWGGHISLGQFSVAGFGGATTAVLFTDHQWNAVLAMLAGVVVAAAVSVLLGLPALRVRGPFYAVTTLAFAVTSFTFFLQSKYVPWFVEPQMARPALLNRFPLEHEWQLYVLALMVLTMVLVAVRRLRRSRTGRVVIAVRDNDTAAEAMTVDSTRVTLQTFAISGGIAGLAGALYVIHQNGLHGDAFTPEASLRLFSMVVIGGVGSLTGAVLGAVYIRGTEYVLSAGWQLIASGGGVLVLLMICPDGLSGLFFRARDRLLVGYGNRRSGPHVEPSAADLSLEPVTITDHDEDEDEATVLSHSHDAGPPPSSPSPDPSVSAAGRRGAGP